MEFDLEEFNEKHKEVIDENNFVYIISKRFVPYNDGEKILNLFKVGKSSKKFTRLNQFKTTLIDFKVHRLYIHTENLNTAIEQMLFSEIKYFFKPITERLKFKNGNETEWFNLTEIDENNFLDFCDKVIATNIFPNVKSYFKFSVTEIKYLKNENPSNVINKNQIQASMRRNRGKRRDDSTRLQQSRESRLESSHDPQKSKL